jgi:hypothetical protein
MSLFLAAFLLSAEPVVAPVAPQPAPAVKPKKEKKICKTDPVDTGSRMPKRTCLTQEQWDSRTRSVSSDEYGAIQGQVGH